MKYMIISVIGLALGILCYACQSLLELDIRDAKVILNSPPDGMTSTNYNQTFWWKEVEGASVYRLQVVSPSFDYIRRLVLDTNVYTNQFTFTFYPDTFEWRIQAKNPAYETQFAQAVFYIDSTAGPQIPILKKPENNTITNDTSILFSWEAAANASNYRILVNQDEDLIISTPLFETHLEVPNTALNIDRLSDGEYTWSARSENEVGWSAYATPRNLMIDRTKPGTPIINQPAPGDSINTMLLSWTRPILGGSAITDSLTIYKDSTGTNPIIAIILNDTVYKNPPGNAGWYRFRVKSFDKAGNEGSWSMVRYFYFKNQGDGKK